MPDLAHWSFFLGATFILLITPGPSIMYVVARGIAQSWRGAVLSSVGLALGDLLQVIATAVGLSALLSSAPKLFAALKLAGALYLVCLGVATLLGKSGRVMGSTTGLGAWQIPSSKSLIVQGFLALNPKTALFFFAFLPQFIVDNAGPVRLQILLFGAVFVLLGFVTNSLFGCLGGRPAALAGHGERFRTATRYASGGVLIALGIAAAFTPNPQTVACCARWSTRITFASSVSVNLLKYNAAMLTASSSSFDAVAGSVIKAGRGSIQQSGPRRLRRWTLILTGVAFAV